MAINRTGLRLNIQTGDSSTDVDVIGNLTVAGLSTLNDLTVTGTLNVPAFSSDIIDTLTINTGEITTEVFTGNTVNVVDLTVTGKTELGDVANVSILGGTAGQHLATDGDGGLYWTDAESGGGGTGTGEPSAPVGSVQFNSAGNFGGSADFTWNGTKLDVNGTVDATTFVGSGASLTNLPAANIAGKVGSAAVADVANSVSGANVVGTVGVATFATTANAVAGANVTGVVASAQTSVTVTQAAQANITSLGTLTGLTVGGAASVNGQLNIDVANLAITGGSAGQVLTTNGAADQSWTTITAGPVVTAGDAGKSPVLDGVGKLDITTIPEGVVLSVNGVTPDPDGDVAIASVFTSTTVGTLADRPTTGVDGDVYIVAGDVVPSNDGFTYIWSGGVGGDWYQIQENQASYDVRYVNLSGDTMTGSLKLIPPVDSTDAATKAYVDAAVAAGPGTLFASSVSSNAVGTITATDVQTAISQVSTQLGTKLPLAGGTLSGPVSLNIAPTLGDHLVNKTYADAIDARNVEKAGDAMTGALTLSGPPTNPLHAATKTYVDSADGLRVAKAGDTMTGPLVLSGLPTLSTHAASKDYVDTAVSGIDVSGKVDVAGDTMTGTLTMQSGAKVIINDTPTIGTHATNKTYVDNLSNGKMPLTGGTFSGGVQFSGNATFNNQLNANCPIHEKNVNMGASSNIDLTGSYFQKTITGLTTFTIATPLAGAISSFVLDLTNGGTNVTWPANVKWAGGVAPTLTASGRDLLGFISNNTNNWTGILMAKDVK